MKRFLRPNSKPDQTTPLNDPPDSNSRKPTNAVEAIRARADYPGMKLIPWNDIWASLKIARTRGNGEMIEVFYDTLYKEAVFDDRGAWSFEVPKNH